MLGASTRIQDAWSDDETLRLTTDPRSRSERRRPLGEFRSVDIQARELSVSTRLNRLQQSAKLLRIQKRPKIDESVMGEVLPSKPDS